MVAPPQTRHEQFRQNYYEWSLVHDRVPRSSGESSTASAAPPCLRIVLAAHKPGLEGPWYVVSHSFSDEVDVVMLGRARYTTVSGAAHLRE